MCGIFGIRLMPLLGRDHNLRNLCSLQNIGKARKKFFPRRKGMQLCGHLDFSSVTPILDS